MTKVKGVMTVLHFMEHRPNTAYGKPIRILDEVTHRNLGKWYEGDTPTKLVKSIKATEKNIFLFI